MKTRIILFGLIGLVVILVGGFLIWSETPARPMPEALAALESDELVEVRQTPNWILFDPHPAATATGMILYPGARIDWRAYAPPAHAIAAQGYRVVIAAMPLNLAIFGVEKASAIIAAFPDTKIWLVGGHSLGGSMAAQYAHNHPEAVKGVFLWGSYPPRGASLAALPLRVISIYGTQDGLSTVEEINASQSLLPTSTEWTPIEGGNHTQFGWYGPQAGDNPATIDRAAQQEQVVSAMAVFLASFSR